VGAEDCQDKQSALGNGETEVLGTSFLPLNWGLSSEYKGRRSNSNGEP